MIIHFIIYSLNFKVPNIDERLQKEIQNHRCNINSSDSGLSSTFSSQSFKVSYFKFNITLLYNFISIFVFLFQNYVQNQTSIDFRIKNLSSMDIANFAGAVSQLSLGEFLFFKSKKKIHFQLHIFFIVYTYSNNIFYKNKMGALTCINMHF